MKRNEPKFGPWSTSLDNGSHLELSAFWKKRMRSLAWLSSDAQRTPGQVLALSIAAAVLVAAVPLVEFGAAAIAADEPEHAAVAAPAAEAPADAATEPSFAKAFERTVNDNGHEKYLIDFDSGEVFEEPHRRFETDREFVDWMRSKGIDAMGQVKTSYKGLLGFDMVVIPTDADSWDPRAGGVIESLEMGDHGTPAIMDARAGLPATFFIETREGGRGVLQIVSIEEDNDKPGPDKVRLRYKPIAAPSKRLIFRPQSGEEDSANWSPLFKSGGLGHYLLMAHVPIGGKFPVRREGSETTLFSVELVSGSDKALSVRMIPPEGEPQRLWLQRDQPVDVVVGGEKYTLLFPTSQVAADSKAETSQATISVTWKPREAAVGKPAGIQFEPVIERTINDDDPARGDFLIDFDSGKVLSPPEWENAEQKQIIEWCAANGVDASGELSRSVEGLFGIDMVVIPTMADNWNPSPRIFAQLDDGKPGTPVAISGRGELPATFLFKTREGGRGVLQILEKHGHDSVKIRYRLAKSSR